MNSLIKGAVLALALLFLAKPASADSILDFAGPPTVGTTATSTFSGSWGTKSGTLLLNDLTVNALEFRDGSFQNLSTGSDTILGASVLIQASFSNGSLDTNDATEDFIRIFDGSDIFYEAKLYGGQLDDLSFFIWDFSSAVSADSGGGAGFPKVNSVAGGNESAWITEASEGLQTSGSRIEFFGAIYNTSGNVTTLSNISGKLQPTPEPGTLVLCGVAALGFAWTRRRRRA